MTIAANQSYQKKQYTIIAVRILFIDSCVVAIRANTTANNVCNIHFIRDTHVKPNNMIHDNNQYYCSMLKHQSVEP